MNRSSHRQAPLARALRAVVMILGAARLQGATFTATPGRPRSSMYPLQNNTRGQMATFLVKALGLP